MNFSEMVKYARAKLNISQESLSKEIGVSFATVNRWEAEKSLPSFKAQKSFLEYCKVKGIKFEESK